MSSKISTEKIAFKGKQVKMPVLNINNFTIAISGKMLKFAQIKDETWQTEGVTDPLSIINVLKKSKLKADIFTFSQRLPYSKPKFKYYYELDNVAAIPISSFDHWWNNILSTSVRKHTRKAQKKGVEVKVIAFDDNLVQGIMDIYNEAPIRQGNRFWHYGKDFETVKKENSTYKDRADFIGAYYNNELIGFIKQVYVGEIANMMQIISKIKDRDKNTTNALIAKAVEVCAKKEITYLTYGNFIYGKKGADTLTEFKKHRGFEKIDIPKYFIPLTLKGYIAIKLGFHHYPHNLLPKGLLNFLLNLRYKWYKKKSISLC